MPKRKRSGRDRKGKAKRRKVDNDENIYDFDEQQDEGEEGEGKLDPTLDFSYGEDCSMFTMTVKGVTYYCCCTNAANTLKIGTGQKTIDLPLLAGNLPHLSPDCNSRRFAAGFFRLSPNISRLYRFMVENMTPESLDSFGTESSKALHQSCFCLMFGDSGVNVTGTQHGLAGMSLGLRFCDVLSTWAGIPATFARFETNNQVVIGYSDYSIDLAEMKATSPIRNFITYEPSRFPLLIVRNRVPNRVIIPNPNDGIFDSFDPIYSRTEMKRHDIRITHARESRLYEHKTKCRNIALMISTECSTVAAGLDSIESCALFLKFMTQHIKPYLRPKGTVSSKQMVKKMKRNFDASQEQIASMVNSANDGGINSVLKFGLKSVAMTEGLSKDLQELTVDDSEEEIPPPPGNPPSPKRITRLEQMSHAIDDLFPEDEGNLNPDDYVYLEDV